MQAPALYLFRPARPAHEALMSLHNEVPSLQKLDPRTGVGTGPNHPARLPGRGVAGWIPAATWTWTPSCKGSCGACASAAGNFTPRREVRGLSRGNGLWEVVTGEETLTAPLVVNAAGAWVDEIARLAGLDPLGLQPKRRTAMLIGAPEGHDVTNWPLMVNVEEEFYFKPDAGALLLSPADETPSPPCDAQPEELDVALAVDRFETATGLEVSRVTHRWAGLRTFAPDKTFVVGFDPRTEGFFWLAGQGGYGVQTSPGMAQLAAALITGSSPLEQAGVGENLVRQLAPGRLLA